MATETAQFAGPGPATIDTTEARHGSGRAVDAGRAGPLARFVGNSTLRLSRLVAGMRTPNAKRLEFRRGGEPFEMMARDRTTIACLWLRATAQPTDGTVRLPVVMAHGWLEVKESHRHRAAPLRAAGHDLLVFDLRAHGQSRGSVATFGCHEKYDVESVIDAGYALGFIPRGRRVITMGNSFGAATMLQHAAVDSKRPGGGRVAGVVAMCPFLNMATAVRSYNKLYAPWLPDRWVQRSFVHAMQKAGFGIDEACTLTAMGGIIAPVLLVGGAKDRNLSLEVHTRKLAAAKTRGSVRLIEVPDASHFNLYRESWPGLDDAMLAFCRDASYRPADPLTR